MGNVIRKKKIIICTIINIVLIIGVALLATYAVYEYYTNLYMYNTTKLVAMQYISKKEECYGLEWRAFIMTKYNIITRNFTIQQYHKVFRRIGDTEICGIDLNGSIYNASIIWPLFTSKESYYIIDNPSILVSTVAHGEIYIVFAIICGIVLIITDLFVIMHLWSKKNRNIKYTPLQIA
jgi:hypothetical protein